MNPQRNPNPAMWLKFPHFIQQRLRQLRWRLTASYALVALAAVLMVEWWGLVGASLFLSNSLSPLTFVQEVIRIAIFVVIPTALILLIPTALLGALLGQITAHWLDQRLLKLSAAARAWQSGDFSRQVLDTTGDEITDLVQTLNTMASQLKELIQTRQELAGVEERNHLARELHDSVKQEGLAALMQLNAARTYLPKDPQTAAIHLQEADALVHQMQQELTGLIWDLRPAGLAGRSLRSAMQAAVESWSRQTRIPANLSFQGDLALPQALEEALFRILQEALANTARHSRAAHVRLNLTTLPGEVTLRISDDGIGFDLASVGETNLGLNSMRERAAALGGSLQIESTPGQGTTLITHLSFS